MLDVNRKTFLNRNFSIIVLDDDPTGTQTIFDVPVLTSWDESEIETELLQKTPLFFILTNSRSLSATDADELAIEIGRTIKNASGKTAREVMVISRGDSTLRGHYPNEVDALARGLGIENSPQILIPAFFQGGRHTYNDIHWVREGDELIPAAETPFAKDSTFGYQSSDLKEYVEEKTNGRVKAKDVISVDLKTIRVDGAQKVANILNGLKSGDVCIVNAFCQKDLDVFANALYRLKESKNQFMFRTAASIIPSLAGVEVKRPLQAEEINLQGKGGIIAVGSYVPKTTTQLEYLKKKLPIDYVEINARNILNDNIFSREMDRVTKAANTILENDKLVVIYTSRELIKGETGDESLRIVNRISRGMVEVMKNISVRPKFIIAKGGITSSDIATKALGIKRALVKGQIIPGVPLWELNDCEKFPNLSYMPFPGNVGDQTSLYNAVKKLTDKIT